MDRQQAQELFTLITTVRHVKKMDTSIGSYYSNEIVAGCLLCEGVRHGLYTVDKGAELNVSNGFMAHFGCTKDEGWNVIWHKHITDSYETTGENYYLAGKELLTKYGYGDLFIAIDTDSPGIEGEGYLAVKPFSEIMDELKRESVTG